MITAGQLREYLATVDPDMPVIIARDVGGSDYSPLAAVGPNHYLAYNAWSGCVTSRHRKDTVEALILEPTN